MTLKSSIKRKLKECYYKEEKYRFVYKNAKFLAFSDWVKTKESEKCKDKEKKTVSLGTQKCQKLQKQKYTKLSKIINKTI